MKKRWELLDTDPVLVAELQQVLGIHPVLCGLLVQRGVRDYESGRHFFRPDLSHLHDPLLLRDMPKAVARLDQAIRKGEKILLYGDYDVDGTTSVALMYSFLRGLHKKIDYYIPDRYREGYGLSREGLEYARDNGVSLLIAMDCGIKAVEQACQARAMGLDLIICDHHLPGEQLPEAVAVLDPKRPDCPYPYKELSGCGVAFKLAQAYAQEQGYGWEILEPLFDFLVVSIASDIVPITGENRVIAHFGLQQLNRTPRPGLRALIERSGRQRPLSISDIVFGMAPVINAAGRVGDARQAVRLMLAGNRKVAADYADSLTNHNLLRREYDRRTATEARELLADQDLENLRSIVLYQPHWHMGVLGIVASRIAHAFHRPTVILTLADSQIVGSVRSVQGFNIHEVIGDCRDLLIDYGGHDYAAGLSLTPSNLPAFKDRFEAIVQHRQGSEKPVPVLPYAAELPLDEIKPKFWRVLRQFAPFGPENENPVFLARGVRDSGYSRRRDGNHLRLGLRQGEAVFTGIAFDQGKAYPKVIKKQPFDICYTIRENLWNGVRKLQLVVKDIRFPEERTEEA